jgi:predicted O-methyltransferase YrrM
VPVSESGTAAYADWPDLPPLVQAAVALARRFNFNTSCRPEQGELLRVLARGVGPGVIGETGTGCGVGLAWLASAADPGATLISVEREPARAAAVAALFENHPGVRVLHADWSALRRHAPFDLLVLDGGGQGKGAEPPLSPAGWLRPGGLAVLDDFTPTTRWPPLHQGSPDTARQYWLTHPDLLATQLNVAPDATTVVAAYQPRP